VASGFSTGIRGGTSTAANRRQPGDLLPFELLATVQPG
jgi:hypothetical protein